ncbi:MAG TPA: hypothetical protein VK054_09070 [Beutenbergiaceae bacterium]|nr:hypothetical protein [Beutenbergiaceae bacterium]
MAGFVTQPYAGDLASLDGETLTFALFTSNADPDEAGGDIDSLSGEVSTSEAPNYSRQTATGEWGNGVLTVTSDPVFDAVGASDIAYVVVADDGDVVAVLSYAKPVEGQDLFTPLVERTIAAPVWFDGVETVVAGASIDVDGPDSRAPEVSVDATEVGHDLLGASSPSDARGVIGAEETGTAASAVSSHESATDPHGDRQYTDDEIAGLAAVASTGSYSDLSDVPDDLVSGDDVTDIVALSQSEYDNISSPDGETLYVVVD